MKTIKQTLLALALGGAFTNANATPVDWTLTDVLITQSNNAGYHYFSGTFTYDADTNLFSSVNLFYTFGGITTSTSTITGNASAISFTASSPYFFSDWLTTLSFASALSNLGGSVLISSGTLCDICSIAANQTITGKPQAIASAVPEPEVYAMMLAGLCLVGFAARRKFV